MRDKETLLTPPVSIYHLSHKDHVTSPHEGHTEAAGGGGGAAESFTNSLLSHNKAVLYRCEANQRMNYIHPQTDDAA